MLDPVAEAEVVQVGDRPDADQLVPALRLGVGVEEDPPLVPHRGRLPGLAVEDEEEPLPVRLDVEAPAAADREGVGPVPHVGESEAGDERNAVRRPDAQEADLEGLPFLLEEVEGGVDRDFLPDDLPARVGLAVKRLVERGGELGQRRVLAGDAVVVAAPQALSDVETGVREELPRHAVEEERGRAPHDLLALAGGGVDGLDAARALDREVERHDAAVDAGGDDVEALRRAGVEQLADGRPLEDLGLRPGKLDRNQRHVGFRPLTPSRAS